MKMVKKCISFLLVLTLLLTLLPAAALAASAGLGNFKTVQTYSAGRFSDVPATAWYEENVKTAYELDLVKGVSDTAYNPSGNITVAATLALACRIHSIYQTGKADFVQGSPWYQVYVDYAVKNGIITANQFTNYNAYATRRQFAAIMAKALPAAALTKKNTVEDGAIPDVDKGSANYDEIYLLYRAGVLTGNDEKGTFTPEKTIQRSAVAAIVSRMALQNLRESVTLKAVPVTKVTLSQSTLSLEVGKTATLRATVQPADASANSLTWKSSNTTVATVSDGGVVTAVKKGTATITASAPSGVKATCTVTVVDVPVAVTSISVSPSSMVLDAGEAERLTVTFQPSNATDRDITWSSSNTSIATVSSGGTVTGRKEGTVTITAKSSNGKTATCRVTVRAEVLVSSVSVYPSSARLEVGETKSLSCSVYPSNATDQEITWKSSDTSVATVSTSGTILARSAGTARITATANNGKYDYCTVTVTGWAMPEFTTPQLNHNYGPMTVTAYYSSGNVQYVNRLTRLEFTKAEPFSSSSDQVDLTLMLQGTSTTDKVYVKMNLYNSSGSLLDSDYVATSVTPNQEFALERSMMVSASALKDASRIEFVSYSNTVAQSGVTDPEPSVPDSGSGDYDMYYGYDIPEFDQFTSAGRSSLDSSSSYVTGYLYVPVTTSERNAYFSALESCGFTLQSTIADSMYIYTKGTSGSDDFMEVRFSMSGNSVRLGLSRIKPSNEWVNGGSDSTDSGSSDSSDGSGVSDPDKEAALLIGVRLEGFYESAMDHLTPVQGYMETVYTQMYDNPYGAANVVGWCVSGLEAFQGDVEDAISVCGSNTYWEDVKAMAEELNSEMDSTIATFKDVRDNTSPKTADVIQARNAYLSLLEDWSAILRASSSVINSL